MPADGDLPISSISSSKELCFPSSHLKEESLTKPSSMSMVLLDIGIELGLTLLTDLVLSETITHSIELNANFISNSAEGSWRVGFDKTFS